MPKKDRVSKAGAPAGVVFDTATSEEKAHAEFSASGSDRWRNCPGSIALSKRAPPQPDSPYAAEGTKAHACLEFFLKNRGQGRDAVTKVARKNFPAEMIDHALAAADYLERRMAEMGDGVEMLVETRVDASPFTCTGQFGTLDVALVDHFGRLVIVDYKYGAGYAVDPCGDDGKGNSQLVYYALGLSYQYDHNFAEVELVVIQPRAYHPSGQTTRSHVMSMDALLAWHQVFRDAVMETGDPKAPLRAGKWCKWCSAGPICPQLKDEALRKAQVVFKDDVGVQSLPEVKMVQLPHLGTILEGCDRLEEWIGKVRAHAVHVLQKGRQVPGWKLVEKRASTRWANDEDVRRVVTNFIGEAAAAAVHARPKLLTPAQARAALLEHPEALDWSEAMIDELLGKVTLKESSGTTLVRDEDKRPPVVGRSSARAVFGTADDGGAGAQVVTKTVSNRNSSRTTKRGK